MTATELNAQVAADAKKETIRLTTAQALVRFLNQQYIDVDGQVTSFVEGLFAIFGHGNVLGLGEALQEDPGHLKVYQGHNEQGMASTAIAIVGNYIATRYLQSRLQQAPDQLTL